uniref:Uncharacterized protein n=1 Tax=Anguilla anguilla TaxID=7936 RepID=A0A0E9U5T1_ANGAN
MWFLSPLPFFPTITTRLLLCRALCSGSSFILLTSDLLTFSCVRVQFLQPGTFCSSQSPITAPAI